MISEWPDFLHSHGIFLEITKETIKQPVRKVRIQIEIGTGILKF
jgi:hypothetical protein